MGVIAKGYTPIGCEYLLIALSEASADPAKRADSLFGKKGSLASRRAVLSNQFHTAKTNEERQEISMQIGAIQVELIDIKRAIETYKRTGKLPVAAEKKARMPADGRSREKKLHSTRTMLSRARKALRTETDPEKVKKHERRIDKLTELARELSA